jgi:hypothetical protein
MTSPLHALSFGLACAFTCCTYGWSILWRPSIFVIVTCILCVAAQLVIEYLEVECPILNTAVTS